ncbi:MAG: protein BatD [Elusimicrobiaceae bacterium]|nr:protein BatD [Elusimicrobiaceae bacterium]MBT3954725.1 protein BatD [Elusimicrobiaceae bacterium]MBT4008317.1 protein BatD [Elusimicrobiaceae bacterium]MBT4402457.1 protein BatD [Elusimicrobiaceae bacterium]MBT4439389.1 protein BatD [Elusimicrobiaceae bacterium]
MNKFFKIILFSTLLITVSAVSWAGISVKAYVDKDVAHLDEEILLNVVVEGAPGDAGLPKLPSMANFNIYSTGQSRSVSIINGNMQSSVRYTYVLSPRFAGKFTVEPIALEYNNKKYYTEKIDLVVVKRLTDKQQFGNAKEIVGQDLAKTVTTKDGKYPNELIFMTAETDKKSAFVNEQIILTTRFYSATENIFGAIYFPPEFKGFFAEEMPPEKRGVEYINGKNYGYVEYKTALFGAGSGRNKVSSASVEYEYKTGSVLDEFFPGFFTSSSKRATVKTTPITLKVDSLPTKNKPANFTGAVGEYKISTSVGKKEIRAGEVFDLNTKISGSGYIRSLTLPKMPDSENFKIYDSLEDKIEVETKNDVLQGYKTFRTSIVAKTEGFYVIPKMAFSYFNPKTRTYEKVYSQPIKVKVLEAREGVGGKLSFTEILPETIKKLGSNINYIKENVETLPGDFAGLMMLYNAGGVKFSIFVIIIVSFVVGFLLREGSQMFTEERICSGILSDIGSAKDYEDIIKTLKGFFHKCLKIKTTKKVKDISKELTKKGYSSNLIKAFTNIWTELENVKYAPSKDGYDIKDLKQKTLAFMDLMSKEMKSRKKG